MISKRCAYCHKDSYSAYDDPNWKCPYCGANIGSAKGVISGVFAGERNQTRFHGVLKGRKVIDLISIKDQYLR